MCNLQTVKNGVVKHYCPTHTLFTDSLRCPLSGFKQASALDLLTKGHRKMVTVGGQIARVVTDETREEVHHGYRSYKTTTYTKAYVPVGDLTLAEVGEKVWWEVTEVVKLTDWGEV